MAVRASRQRPGAAARALIEGGAGIETLSIERPGLHDAFIVIAGEAAAREMGHVQAQGGCMKLPETIRAAFVIARRDFTATVFPEPSCFSCWAAVPDPPGHGNGRN
jgi:hypothetical protein